MCLALSSTVGLQSQGTPASGRPPVAPRSDEVAVIAEGWGLLAQGDLTRAAAKAAEAVKLSPRSTTACALGLEVAIARGRSRGALDFYESWLGARTLEEPGALRRIARAVLTEESANGQEPAARLEALQALAGDGDASAVNALAAPPNSAPNAAGVAALAARGDAQSVTTLIAGLREGPADVRNIDALGASGRAEAVPALLDLLADPRQEVRGTVAEALGRLGGSGTAARLAPLLADRSAWVRAKAAGALLRLGDETGLPVLKSLAAEPSSDLKMLAAEAMAIRPDAAWHALVLELAASPDAMVRATAARLMAPYDAALARSLLEPLLSDPNGAIREMAGAGLGDAVSLTDLTLLRLLLRVPAKLTTVRAAARVLVITR